MEEGTSLEQAIRRLRVKQRPIASGAWAARLCENKNPGKHWDTCREWGFVSYLPAAYQPAGRTRQRLIHYGGKTFSFRAASISARIDSRSYLVPC